MKMGPKNYQRIVDAFRGHHDLAHLTERDIALYARAVCDAERARVVAAWESRA